MYMVAFGSIWNNWCACLMIDKCAKAITALKPFTLSLAIDDSNFVTSVGSLNFFNQNTFCELNYVLAQRVFIIKRPQYSNKTSFVVQSFLISQNSMKASCHYFITVLRTFNSKKSIHPMNKLWKIDNNRRETGTSTKPYLLRLCPKSQVNFFIRS